MLPAMGRGDFYILCPDNDVPREMDERRILWAAGDIVENRPPLSRWHPDYKEAFAKFAKAEASAAWRHALTAPGGVGAMSAYGGASHVLLLVRRSAGSSGSQGCSCCGGELQFLTRRINADLSRRGFVAG